MSRVEENAELVRHFTKAVYEFPSGKYEEMVSWHLGVMNSFLTDISKSLAVIADAMAEREADET